MIVVAHHSSRAAAALLRGEPGYDPDSYDVSTPSADAQLRANARQLHRYLTGETECRCGAVVRVGARRCSACGSCAECGYFGCRAGAVSCEQAIEQRWARYVARVAPLVRVASLVGAGLVPVARAAS